VALGSSQTNEELALKAKAGDRVAIDRLVKQNAGLVHMVARKYPMPGVQYEDQVQEGFIGLLQCVETFNPEKGLFTTHAVHRIKANIIRKGNEQAQTIQIPSHVFETRLEINKFIKDFISMYKKRPTVQQIAEGINKSVDNIRNLMITDSIGQPASIDASINVNDDEVNVSETYGGEWLEDSLIKEQKYNKMLEFVSELPEPEKTIIECLYGLNGKMVHSIPMLEGKIKNSVGATLSSASITSRHTLALTFLEDRGMGLNIPYVSPRDRRASVTVVTKDLTKRDIFIVLSKEAKQAFITFEADYVGESVATVQSILMTGKNKYLFDNKDALVLQYKCGILLENLEDEIKKCFNDVVNNGFTVIL